jgi:hypothetical protein
MTIIEAITRIDSLKPNTYAQCDKVKWLSQLDGLIKSEVIDTHEGADAVIFNGYDDNTDDDTVLLVPAPYDNVYISWLESRIDYANGEINRYQNSSIMYNTDYTKFVNYYNRTHMPIETKRKYF